MKLSKKLAKKGAISSVLTDFWAYIAFVFVVIIFYIIFTVQSIGVKENKITAQASYSKATIQLLNYLRTPYIDGKDMTMSELMGIYYDEKDESSKKNYHDRLLRRTKEILDPSEYCKKIFSNGLTSERFVLVGYSIRILDKEDVKSNNPESISVRGGKFFSSEHYSYVDPSSTIGSSMIFVPSKESKNGFYVAIITSAKNVDPGTITGIKNC